MYIVVNYIIKNKKIEIKNYQVDGKNVVLYARHGLAVMDESLDVNQDLTLIKGDDDILPQIVSQAYAEELQKEIERLQEKEKKEGEADGR